MFTLVAQPCVTSSRWCGPPNISSITIDHDELFELPGYPERAGSLINRPVTPRNTSVARAVTGPTPGCVSSNCAPQRWPACSSTCWVQNLDLLSDPHVHRLQSASPISTMGRERRDAIDFCPAGLHSEDPRRSPFAKAIACKAFWMRVRLRTH